MKVGGERHDTRAVENRGKGDAACPAKFHQAIFPVHEARFKRVTAAGKRERKAVRPAFEVTDRTTPRAGFPGVHHMRDGCRWCYRVEKQDFDFCTGRFLEEQ